MIRCTTPRDTIGADCRNPLEASPEAAAQWKQEGAFHRFGPSFRTHR
ncbi:MULTISPECIES: hypothetical protein [unclassified Streptomyces]|nr:MULTISPECIES: hypothetical protein [unclassified Streptomyces]WAX77794.1 hypothetical protein HUV60_008995 [Streptomyces sp. KMM 9044]